MKEERFLIYRLGRVRHPIPDHGDNSTTVSARGRFAQAPGADGSPELQETATRMHWACPLSSPSSSPPGRGVQKGLAALQQYIAREGALPGRAGVQETPDGDIHCVAVWLANQKQRRDRLDQAQRAALADLGVHWA